MHIGSISSVAPIAPEPIAQRPVQARAASNPTDSDASTESHASAPKPSSVHASATPASAPAIKNDPMVAAYSTHVAGKGYAGSVSENNGIYYVSVPNLPGAHATGTSIQSAENNLTLRIDELA